jgi:dihydroorotate dehydrogenase (fumarate)
MDLSTRYLGMVIENPLVPSASPLSRSLDSARHLEDAGAAALVMHSLFEEEIRQDGDDLVRLLHHQDSGHGNARDLLPRHQDFSAGLDAYLEQLQILKRSLEIPVVASLNGATLTGWVEYGQELERAGADALELNVYYVAADPDQPGAAVEARYIELLKALRRKVELPIAMKLTPQLSSIPNMVKRLEEAGADGVTLFNRFYQPDINPNTLQVVPAWHPSGPADALLSMRWIAMLYRQVDLTLAASSGIHHADDAIKMILAGADVTHLCTALLQRGPEYLRDLRLGLEAWMEELGFESVEQMKGAVSQHTVRDRAAFERTHYIHVLDTYSFPDGDA